MYEHSHVGRAQLRKFKRRLRFRLLLAWVKHAQSEKIESKRMRILAGSVPVASFYALFNTLKENHEIEDDKIEKIAGFRLHEMKEKNGGVVYRDDDETVTEEQRKIARDVEAKLACSVDVEGTHFNHVG